MYDMFPAAVKMSTIQPRSLEVKELEEAVFTCQSRDKVRWRYNGKDELPSNAITLSKKKGYELNIFPSVIENSGVYSCVGLLTDKNYGFYDEVKLTVQSMLQFLIGKCERNRYYFNNKLKCIFICSIIGEKSERDAIWGVQIQDLRCM